MSAISTQPTLPSKVSLSNSLLKALLTFICLAFLTACAPQVQQSADLTVSVTADGASKSIVLPPGSTVQQALDAAKVSLASTDRVDPPGYTFLTDGMAIVVTRVHEEFDTKQVVLPFERQELRNESLTSGETRLIQAGQNGLEEVTTRHVFENNVETDNSVVSETVLQASVPEIVMVGVQSPFAPITIPGKLVYRTTDGNAWIMDGSTSTRQPLVTTGDVDGYIFSLSPDGAWLLFTRKSTLPPDQEINTLWAVSTSGQPAAPVNLGVSNIVHFADWQPGETYQIAYSTVHPQAAAPGWNANNDLHILPFQNGKPGKIKDILDTNYGGVYPWWGSSFSWSPDGHRLAYSRPDGVGLADTGGAGLTTLLNITSFNTQGDWAWTPGLAWGADNQTLYLVTHAPPSGLVAPEDSPNFDLDALSLSNNTSTTLVPGTGMFAYPAVSSLRNDKSGNPTYLVAYLQAVFPTASATSRYNLMIINKDGSAPRTLFPAEGQPGLASPQPPVWAPSILNTGSDFIAIIYEHNLWIVDAASGQSQQVTGDGLTSNIDWK
ncbi:MAG: G5 domain-containing protein [Anaerolineales bacterium]